MDNIQNPNQDLDHLRLLSIFHYVVGGLGIFFGFIPLIYVAIGLLFLWIPDTQQDKPPEGVAYMFMILGSIGFVLAQILSILILVSGKYIKKKIKYNYSFVLACIECLLIPFGTVLGVFTILVLSRPSVKKLYGR